MNLRIAVFHMFAYAIVAPFWGGFWICLIKYLLETTLGLPLAFFSSIGGGLGAIVFYGVPGMIVGAFSLPFAMSDESNGLSNLIASVCLAVLAYCSTDFTKGYSLVVLLSGLAFCHFVCECEHRLLLRTET